MRCAADLISVVRVVKLRTALVCLLLSVTVNSYASEQSCIPIPPTSPQSQTEQLETEWKRAIDQDKVADLKRLLPGVDVALTNNKGKTALMAAVKVGDNCLLQELMQRGLKFSTKSYTGGTALMYAVLGNQPEMIEKVLSYQPDPDEQSTNGWTAVMIAAAKGFRSAVLDLHQAGADINLPDVYQWTPLMRAIDNRHTDVAVYLLAAPGINVNHTNENGSSALHIAALTGETEIVTTLLQLGSDKDLQDKNGLTPADVAETAGYADLSNKLR